MVLLTLPACLSLTSHCNIIYLPFFNVSSTSTHTKKSQNCQPVPSEETHFQLEPSVCLSTVPTQITCFQSPQGSAFTFLHFCEVILYNYKTIWCYVIVCTASWLLFQLPLMKVCSLCSSLQISIALRCSISFILKRKRIRGVKRISD